MKTLLEIFLELIESISDGSDTALTLDSEVNDPDEDEDKPAVPPYPTDQFEIAEPSGPFRSFAPDALQQINSGRKKKKKHA